MAQAAARPLKNKMIGIYVNDLHIVEDRPAMNEAEFIAFCNMNPNLRIEQDKHGNLFVMPPTSLESGNYESEILTDLVLWNRRAQLGKTFSPSTLYLLPDGEKRMPDASWIALDRYEALSVKQKRAFGRIVPDFIIEVRSPSDNLEELKSKIIEIWIPNGVRLAWLIDPIDQCAWVFRGDGSSEKKESLEGFLSGEGVLPGFEYDLQNIKTPPAV
jgi:Uma2 family endonuclease